MVNGEVDSVTALVNKPGLMALFTPVNGVKIERMARVSLSMWMVTFMMDTGLMIKQTAQESISM